jgi:hypothetical protein
MNVAPRLPLRVLREALQAAARETLRLCRLSEPAQAGSSPSGAVPPGKSRRDGATGLGRPSAAASKAPTLASPLTMLSP